MWEYTWFSPSSLSFFSLLPSLLSLGLFTVYFNLVSKHNTKEDRRWIEEVLLSRYSHWRHHDRTVSELETLGLWIVHNFLVEERCSFEGFSQSWEKTQKLNKSLNSLAWRSFCRVCLHKVGRFYIRKLWDLIPRDLDPIWGVCDNFWVLSLLPDVIFGNFLCFYFKKFKKHADGVWWLLRCSAAPTSMLVSWCSLIVVWWWHQKVSGLYLTLTQYL